DIAGVADLGAATGFQSLLKSGVGQLSINGAAGSGFTTVVVRAGTLDIASGGSVAGVMSGGVATGATLRVDGKYLGSNGADTMIVAGAVSGSGVIDLGAGDDMLTVRDAAMLNATIDGGTQTAGDTLVLDNAA